MDENGKEVMYSTEDFNVLPVPYVPRPWIYSPSYPSQKHFLEIFMEEFINKGEPGSALEIIKRGEITKRMRFLAGKAKFLLGDFNSAVQYLSNLKETQDFSVFYLLARSFDNKGDFKEAILYYEKAMKIGGENVELLNSIALCYYKLGLREDAKRYFERSLKFDPEQKEIIEFLKKL